MTWIGDSYTVHFRKRILLSWPCECHLPQRSNIPLLFLLSYSSVHMASPYKGLGIPHCILQCGTVVHGVYQHPLECQMGVHGYCYTMTQTSIMNKTKCLHVTPEGSTTEVPSSLETKINLQVKPQIPVLKMNLKVKSYWKDRWTSVDVFNDVLKMILLICPEIQKIKPQCQRLRRNIFGHRHTIKHYTIPLQ